ncbi:MAG TPA: hypothetical protein VL225_02470 [Vicinamibacterales bacterium]|jgi:hypothetical protein|nr:hypothetical protein [Vicinamibacterales bacterium]
MSAISRNDPRPFGKNALWSRGISNPLELIEQITYLPAIGEIT